MKQYHFISGLPRSGSTLLSSILLQNPRFHAGITSLLLTYARGVIENGNTENKSQFNEKQIKRIFKSTIDAFYDDVDKPVIFDTNRLWTNLLPQIKDCYENSKVICCVRDINSILDSFERLQQKNPYSISTVFPSTNDMHVYSRVSCLMDENGIVNIAYTSLKSAICGMNSDILFLVEYEILCKEPEGVMRSLYEFIGEPYFNHDFNNVEISFDEYDRDVNLKGLHKTRKKVEWIEKKPIIPPDIFERYKDLEVWRNIR